MASSVFLSPALGITSSGGSITTLFADGTAGAPSMAFQSEPTLGFRRSSAAVITLQGTLTATANLSSNGNVLSGLSFIVPGGFTLTAPAGEGIANLTNSIATSGIGLDLATDAVLKIRTRAQTGYATVDALGYKVSGVAGVAAFGPSAVASLTIVNGIVTAAS